MVSTEAAFVSCLVPLTIANALSKMHASCTTGIATAIISLPFLIPPFPIGTFIAVGVGVGACVSPLCDVDHGGHILGSSVCKEEGSL